MNRGKAGKGRRRPKSPGETQALRILFTIEVSAFIALALGSAAILNRLLSAGIGKWIPGFSLLLGWAVWKLLETRK